MSDYRRFSLVDVLRLINTYIMIVIMVMITGMIIAIIS